MNRNIEHAAMVKIHSDLLDAISDQVLYNESLDIQKEAVKPVLQRTSNNNAAVSAFKSKLSLLPASTCSLLKQTLDNGWQVYNPFLEYGRMGIPDASWRMSVVNSSYDVCPTYPNVLVVPADVDDATLRQSAQFRSKGRFPVLVWRNKINKCTISRCSQPLVGITQNRSAQDEELIEKINRASGLTKFTQSVSGKMSTELSLMPSKPYIIFDARPLLNATANQAAGKGFENEKNYDNVSVIFMDIANIHAVRKSLETLEGKMVSACCS